MKQILRLLALTVWVFLANTPADAAASLSEIGGRLTKASVICGDFTQSKTLQALTRPLVSRGRIVFVGGKGVLWQVLEPFPARVLVKKETLTRWNDDGAPQTVNYGQNPIFGALSQVFFSVFTGRIEGLNDRFAVESSLTPARWTLTLVPRTPELGTIIAGVQVSGGAFVDQLVIAEKRGDRTIISFSNINTESCRLSDAEKAYFAQ